MGIDHRLTVSYFGICLFNMILLASINGTVMAATTPVSEIALPKEVSAANSIVVDTSGNVWFAEKVGKNLTMLDPETKTFKVYPLPASWGNIGPSRITFSPQGDIWFTVRRWADSIEGTNVLGRFVISDSSFHIYSLPAQAVPEEIVVDAGGVVWFLSPNENKLYRFKPETSALKGYAIPTVNGYPRGIALDNKGNIWFSQANANQIGNFIPETGVFHEHKIPTPFANPGEITVDRDGKIWFVELTANRIGVFYPDRGRFDEALIPTPRGMPNAIVADGKGNLWFLEYRGNKVGVFNPVEATFREYDIPSFNSQPGALAIDHKRGILWFSETSTEVKKLGMLSMKAALMQKMDEDKTSKQPSEDFSTQGSTAKTAYMGFIFLAFVLAMTGAWSWYSRKGSIKR